MKVWTKKAIEYAKLVCDVIGEHQASKLIPYYERGYVQALADVRKECEGYYPHASAVTMRIVEKLEQEDV